MSKYNDHIAIVGAGIAGLALGCFLQKYQIKNIMAGCDDYDTTKRMEIL